MDKAQMRSLKQLSRSELLEVMLALKRENDILRVENVRLKTLKHKLEQHIMEITDTLQELKLSAYPRAIEDYAYNSPENAAESELDGSLDNGYEDTSEIDEIDYGDTYGEADENQYENSGGYSFDSVFDNYVGEVTKSD